ncbi:MAG TPA: RNA polymerase factor sigma-32, partial [Stellaceae bacterium]|nr:RNA polymerase factor sigma-32 [Stellaceae bacterium]
IDDWATQRANLGFIKASMRVPLLTREREFDLARRWRAAGDTAALHELVRAYTRLVIATAIRFRAYGLPLGDLVQEGNVGLLQAAARFEPAREVRFSTYANWWIRSAMQDYVLRNWSIVRTGSTAAQKALFFNLRRLRARIGELSGAPLGAAGHRRIAAALGVELAEVEHMDMRLSAVDHSLNGPVGDGDHHGQDFIADGRPSPEQAAIALADGATRARWLAEALQSLTPRERRIISARHLSEDAVTLEALGRLLGVSKERVRQLEHRALLKLRRALGRHARNPADLFHEED